MLKIWPCQKNFVSLHCKQKGMISQNTQTHTVMENTLSDVIFEPSEADFEFADAMCDGLDASFRVPSVEEVNAHYVNFC